MIRMEYCSSALHLQKSCSTPWSDSQRQCNCWNTLPKPCRVCNPAAEKFNTSCGSKMIKGFHHSVEDLHQTRSWNLTTWTFSKRDMGFAGLFWDRITLEQVRTVLFMTSCSNSCAVSMPDWMMSCLLRRALQSQNVDGTNWLLSLASSQECWKHLAEALHSLQSGGRQTFLYCLWPAAEAYKASIIQFFDLHQTRAWHWKYRHASRKAVLRREPKKASLLPPLNGPVPTGVRCPCQTVWCLVCWEEISKVIMWTEQIGSCLVSTWSLAASRECEKHLAEALHSLQPGRRLTFLYCLRPAAEAYKASIISNKSLALKTLLCIAKSSLQMRTKKGYFATSP